MPQVVSSFQCFALDPEIVFLSVFPTFVESNV